MLWVTYATHGGGEGGGWTSPTQILTTTTKMPTSQRMVLQSLGQRQAHARRWKKKAQRSSNSISSTFRRKCTRKENTNSTVAFPRQIRASVSAVAQNVWTSAPGWKKKNSGKVSLARLVRLRKQIQPRGQTCRVCFIKAWSEPEFGRINFDLIWYKINFTSY